MGRTSSSTKLKNAWIDEEKRIISFTCLENAEVYLAEEEAFWNQILRLMRSGYRMQ
ncbi:MAG: hypothetical protein ACI3XG_00050 [Faecousia sp.]